MNNRLTRVNTEITNVMSAIEETFKLNSEWKSNPPTIKDPSVYIAWTRCEPHHGHAVRKFREEHGVQLQELKKERVVVEKEVEEILLQERKLNHEMELARKRLEMEKSRFLHEIGDVRSLRSWKF